MKRLSAIAIVFFLLCGSVGYAGDIYVRQSASESGDGTRLAPFSTLEQALREAREWRRLGDERIRGGITIWVENGVYTSAQTILIRPEDSGTADSPTRVRAVSDQVVFSGGLPVSGWRPAGKVKGVPAHVAKRLFVADAPKAGGKFFPVRQLWVDDQKAVRAESHDDSSLPRILNWDFKKGTATIPNIFPDFQLTAGVEFFIHQWWAVAQLRVRDMQVFKDSIQLAFHEPEARIQNEHPWPKPWLSKEHGNSAFRLVNAIAFLDQPGEWFLDEDTHRIYYYPREGQNMTTVAAMVPYLETIVQVAGTLENPVKYFTMEGIQFRYSAWLRPHTHGHVALQAGMYFVDAYKLAKPGTPDKAGLENQAWVGRPKASVQLENTAYTAFRNCSFTHLAATGIDYRSGNYSDTLEGNMLQDIGGSAILLGEFSAEQFEAHLPYQPKDERVLSNGIYVANNLIQQIGVEDWGAVGIGAGFVRNVEIKHNELLDLPYTGISLGWGWTPTLNSMQNNQVFENKITRYGKFMYDVAGIYTLSAQPGTKIQRNLIDSIYRSPYAHIPDHWFYLYTDEGSAYMNISDNWFPSNKILQNANGPNIAWVNNGPDVDKKLVKDAGLQPAFARLRKQILPLDTALRFNAYIPFTKPVFFQIYDPQRQLTQEEIETFLVKQGGEPTNVFHWKNYTLLLTTDELSKKMAGAWLATYPQVEYKLFNNLFYSFDRSRCDVQTETQDTDFVLLTAQLRDDKSKEEAYLEAHKKQYEEWPEVAKGFCQAGFEEVLLYRNNRQLMLYISFPKGKKFEDIDPLTLKDNPRVEEWNRLMGTYQEGIAGTAANETWIFYKK
ncbi:L-rhamnose mutarotase [Sphingobacterium sp. LRF_L2]|uniref:L-rhamnose mutarotase n=1 Tax=Sphingobacterium sp. LRF_L2 TaxID=3369421 RepID=UPI003F6394B8